MRGESKRESTPCLLCGSEGADPYLESEVQLAPASGERFSFVRCGACELVYLNPRPAESELARYYPPEYPSHRGPEEWGRWAFLVRGSERRMDRARVRRVRRHVELGPDARILDLGCGRPTFLRELYRRTGAHCVGIDVSAAGWCADPEAWKGLTLLEGTLEAREAEVAASGPYDAVTLWHALEHDYRPAETLRALHRLSVPDAGLVVEVPDLDSLSARRHGSAWAGLHTPRHTAAYTPDRLADMLEAGGWTVERSLRFGTLDPTVLWWLGRAVRAGDDLSGSLEPRFAGFLALKAGLLPLTLLRRWVPLGIQTAVGRAR